MIAGTMDADRADHADFLRRTWWQDVLDDSSALQIRELGRRKLEVVREHGLELRLEIG
jgi:hypothetical protein